MDPSPAGGDRLGPLASPSEADRPACLHCNECRVARPKPDVPAPILCLPLLDRLGSRAAEGIGVCREDARHVLATVVVQQGELSSREGCT